MNLWGGMCDWVSSRWHDRKLNRAFKRRDFLRYVQLLKERWEALAPDVIEGKLAVFLRVHVVEKLSLLGFDGFPQSCVEADQMFWSIFPKTFAQEVECRLRVFCDLLNEDSLWQIIAAAAKEAMGVVQQDLEAKQILLTVSWPSLRQLIVSNPE